MPISINPQMMREIIMDHYNNPLHKNVPQNLEGYKKIRMDSVKIEDDKIIDACFEGVACTISTSSTDILCDLIIGKSLKDALYIVEQYKNMIYEKDFDDSVLDELIVFINTHKQAARIKCATLGPSGVEDIINGKDDK